MREAVLERLLTPPPGGRARREPGLVERAVALRAHVADADRLSTGERTLLAEWLDRIAAAR